LFHFLKTLKTPTTKHFQEITKRKRWNKPYTLFKKGGTNHTPFLKKVEQTIHPKKALK